MATENVNRPDTFYRDCLRRLVAADQQLAHTVRRDLDGILRTLADAAARLARLATFDGWIQQTDPPIGGFFVG